jgi:hypothetical protein
VVVVRLPLRSDKLSESSKESSRYKAARMLKNCMGTPMAFESQVENSAIDPFKELRLQFLE